MKLSIAIILLLSASIITAQNTIYWEGGTPGNETAWDESRNWSDHRIPDEFSHVVINTVNSGHASQPVISESIEVASLEIHSGCSLTIEEGGEIMMDGHTYSENGIELYGGKLYNEGIIRVMNITSSQALLLQNQSLGDGLVIADESELTNQSLVKK